MTARAREPISQLITSLKDRAVVAARQNLGQVGTAAATCYLIEGHEIVRQALASPSRPEAVFLRGPGDSGEDNAVRRDAAAVAVPCHRVSRGIFVRLHDLGYETSVTALAIIKRRFVDTVVHPHAEDCCLLVGETIQDPKNVGSLIRTADAWGVTAAAFTADSADPFSRGSVRASTGSILRMPVASVANLEGYLGRLKEERLHIVGTSAAAPTRCWDADLTGPCAILVGNESAGLSARIRQICDALVSIPMYGGAHSFNVAVAAGIILYERLRQRSSRA